MSIWTVSAGTVSAGTGSLSFVIFSRIHYTSESPVLYISYEKIVKWCIS